MARAGILKMLSRHLVLTSVLLILVFFVLTTVMVSLNHKRIKVRLANGDVIEVTPASLYESLHRASCEIEIRTSSKGVAKIVLYQDFWDSPIIVIPTTNANVFFCVFDYDVDTQLLRIDLNEPFDAGAKSSFIKGNVLFSTCKIERVSTHDNAAWEAACVTLQGMPDVEYKREATGLDLLLFYTQIDRQSLMAVLKNRGSQGLYGRDF